MSCSVTESRVIYLPLFIPLPSFEVHLTPFYYFPCYNGLTFFFIYFWIFKHIRGIILLDWISAIHRRPKPTNVSSFDRQNVWDIHKQLLFVFHPPIKSESEYPSFVAPAVLNILSKCKHPWSVNLWSSEKEIGLRKFRRKKKFWGLIFTVFGIFEGIYFGEVSNFGVTICSCGFNKERFSIRRDFQSREWGKIWNKPQKVPNNLPIPLSFILLLDKESNKISWRKGLVPSSLVVMDPCYPWFSGWSFDTYDPPQLLNPGTSIVNFVLIFKVFLIDMRDPLLYIRNMFKQRHIH